MRGFFLSNMNARRHMIKHTENVCLSVFMHELTFTFPPQPLITAQLIYIFPFFPPSLLAITESQGHNNGSLR